MKNSKILRLFLSVFLFLATCIGSFLLVNCGKGNASSQVEKKIELSMQTLVLTQNEDYTLKATYYKNGDSIEAEFVWSSSDEAVATVNQGKITAVAEGTCRIVAAYHDAEAICALTVNKYYETPMEVKLNYYEITLCGVNSSFTLKAEIWKNGIVLDKEVEFASKNEDIISVSKEGQITSLALGMAVVEVKASDGEFFSVSSCIVHVEEAKDKAVITKEEEKYCYIKNSFYTEEFAFAETPLSVADAETNFPLDYIYREGKILLMSEPATCGKRYVKVEGEHTILYQKIVFVSALIATPQEMFMLSDAEKTDYAILVKNIDFTEYLQDNPWNTNTAFFNFDLKCTLDGKGFGLYHMECTQKETQRWENSIFYSISGTLENLYIEGKMILRSGQNDGWSGLCENSTLVGVFSGEINHCVIHIKSVYRFGTGEQGETECQRIGLFYRTESGAKMTNTLIYAPNDKTTRLFTSDSWSEAEKNGGIFENVIFIRGDMDYNSLLSERTHNSNLKDIYLFSSLKSLQSQIGEKLTDNYSAQEKNNDKSFWISSNALSLPSDIVIQDYTVSFFGQTVIDERDTISSAEEFVEKLLNSPSGVYTLTTDIDFTQYLNDHPWNTNSALISDFSGVLDGNGFGLYHIQCTAATTQRWENSIFYSMSGEIKNLFVESSINIQSGYDYDHSTYYQGSTFIGNFTGKLSDCVFKLNNEYKYSNGQNGQSECNQISMFYRATATAEMRNCLIIAPQDTTTRLFTSTSFSEEEYNQGMFVNNVFIRPALKTENALGLQINQKIEGVYVYESVIAAENAQGLALIAGYASGTVANGDALWVSTSQSMNDVLQNITATNGKIIFFGRNIF